MKWYKVFKDGKLIGRYVSTDYAGRAAVDAMNAGYQSVAIQLPCLLVIEKRPGFDSRDLRPKEWAQRRKELTA